MLSLWDFTLFLVGVLGYINSDFIFSLLSLFDGQPDISIVHLFDGNLSIVRILCCDVHHRVIVGKYPVNQCHNKLLFIVVIRNPFFEDFLRFLAAYRFFSFIHCTRTTALTGADSFQLSAIIFHGTVGDIKLSTESAGCILVIHISVHKAFIYFAHNLSSYPMFQIISSLSVKLVLQSVFLFVLPFDNSTIAMYG